MLQFGCEFFLLADGGDDALLAFLQFGELFEAFLHGGHVFFVHRAGHLLAVAGDERDGGAFVQENEFSTGSADKLLNLGAASAILKGRLEEHYIDIPMKFVFSIPYQGNRFFAFAGPTAAIGVSSKLKGDVKILGFQLKGDFLDMYDRDIFENMDFMLGGGIGADIGKMLRVTMGYNFGMFNRIDT